MFGWGVTLMVIGGASFFLPLFGRQFALVSLVGLSGVGSVVAGIFLFFVGLVLYIQSQKNSSVTNQALNVKEQINEILEQKSEASHVNEAEKFEAFKVEDLSSFKRSVLSPNDFGREVARISLESGRDLTQAYIEGLRGESDFDKAVIKRYPFLLIAFSSVLMGGFLCYARQYLGASQISLVQMKSGIASQISELLPELNEDDIKGIVPMVDYFGTLIGREVFNDEKGLVADFFVECITNFYKAKNPDKNIVVDIALSSYGNGLGDTVMVNCRDTFKISLLST